MRNRYNEEMKEFMLDFLRNAMSGDGSFRMERHIATAGNSVIRTTHHLFMQTRVGNGKYIYDRSGYNANDIYTSLAPNFQLIAIVTEEAAYFLETATFSGLRWWKDDEWRELSSSLGECNGNSNFVCCFFNAWYKKFCEDYKQAVLIPHYDSLESLTKLDDELEYECKIDARNTVVFGKQGKYLSDFEFENPPRENVAQLLCGVEDSYNQERKTYMEFNTEAMREHKTCRAYAQQLVDANAGFEDWELELIHALRSAKDSIKASVTFSRNGKEATGKMTPKAILKSISRNYPIFFNDFCSHKEGRDVLSQLQCLANTCLYHEHIVKIMHGGKTLYEKN